MFCFCHDGLCLCIACFGCLSYHQRCVGVCSCGFGQERQGLVFIRKNGQLWAGQRWSDMNNMYGWLGGEKHMSWRRKTSLDGSLHFLSFTMAHSEGGAGNRYEGSGSMLFHVRGLLDGFPGWLWHRSYPQFVWSRLSREGGLLRVRTARR